MRTTLIVPDNAVYVNGRVATVDLSSLAQNIRAVQWEESAPNTGFTESLNGTNTAIGVEEFAAYDTFVAAAQVIFDAEDEAARLYAEQQKALNVVIENANTP